MSVMGKALGEGFYQNKGLTTRWSQGPAARPLRALLYVIIDAFFFFFFSLDALWILVGYHREK
jgi:hypothetical protein